MVSELIIIRNWEKKKKERKKNYGQNDATAKVQCNSTCQMCSVYARVVQPTMFRSGKGNENAICNFKCFALDILC